MKEIEEMEKRYSRRSGSNSGRARKYSVLISEEREKVYRKILEQNFGTVAERTMIEIGAGNGSNIPFFLQAGFKKQSIFANELLRDRVAAFKERFPDITLFAGNALDIDSKQNKYDLVFQSTVFSSILDMEFRKLLAAKMLELVKPGGIILSYDFVYNNPSNPDVRKVPAKELMELFPDCSFQFYKVTLAPPIGRRLPFLYKILNTVFPFLRSHLIAVIKKKQNA